MTTIKKVKVSGTSYDIESTLNADLNLSNLSATGKSTGAGFFAPSNSYVDITVGTSGSVYVAPANGYILLRMTATAGDAGRAIKLVSGVGTVENPEDNIKLALGWTSVTSANAMNIYLPVAKDDRVKYVYTVPSIGLRFYYAKGEI